MYLQIAVLNGDGIGPEVTAQSIKVLKTVAQRFDHHFSFEHASIGAIAIDETGHPFPPETEKICMDADAILFGAIGDPKYDNDPHCKIRPEQGLLQLRKSLNLYANIRPVQSYPSIFHLSPLKPGILEGLDLVIFRELTGGLYFGKKELAPDHSFASDECIYSKSEIYRIALLAFKEASVRKNKLTLVDKANVLETSRLWRMVVQEMSKQFPKVEVNYLFVDNAAMQLILNPAQFDVILTENMFGDILSDEASVITGSLGMLPSASVGDNTALFEPIHGSFPQAAGKDIANPMGSILSSAMMLEHFGLKDEASLVKSAVQWCLESNFVTRDLDGLNYYFTSTIGDLIADYVNKGIAGATNPKNIETRKSTLI